VERHGRDLEPEPGEEQDQGQDQQRLAAVADGLQGAVDGLQVRGAGEREHQRHAEQDQRGRKRTQDEIFQRGLGRPGLGLEVAHQDVHGDGHELEADVQGDQVGGAGQQHHARDAEEDEGVVFGRGGVLLVQEARGDEHGEEAGRQEDPLEEQSEPVQRVHLVEGVMDALRMGQAGEDAGQLEVGDPRQRQAGQGEVEWSSPVQPAAPDEHQADDNGGAPHQQDDGRGDGDQILDGKDERLHRSTPTPPAQSRRRPPPAKSAPGARPG